MTLAGLAFAGTAAAAIHEAGTPDTPHRNTCVQTTIASTMGGATLRSCRK
jgi:hypothetical protein